MERCCECKYWRPSSVHPAYGKCRWATDLPVTLPVPYRNVNVETNALDGTDCPCFERKEMGHER